MQQLTDILNQIKILTIKGMKNSMVNNINYDSRKVEKENFQLNF